ncbi:MAG: YciI family protein [Vicinamibacterales bacterium]|nr:YciI family protein [Vicinamibacterales bacterium]
MYAIAIVRYRRPLEEVIVHQEPHRAYLRELKAQGTLLASGPQDPRYGGIFLLRVPDDNVQAALDKVRDDDPFYQAGVAQYELLPWNVIIGKDDLDTIIAR